MASILVVDDDAVVTRLLKLRLECAGHRVEIACNGQEALERVGESSFDCVITDMCMPRMGGRELCESIRGQDPEGGPVIFVVTSRPEDEYRDWTRQLRNVEFMEKPVSLQRLAVRIAERLPADGGDS